MGDQSSSSVHSESQTIIQTSPGNSQTIFQTIQDKSPFSSEIILDDNENNYSLWSQFMEMRIGARNKSGFLTGARKKPSLGDKELEAWIIELVH